MYTARKHLETCSHVVQSNTDRGDLIHAPSGSGIDLMQEVLLTTQRAIPVSGPNFLRPAETMTTLAAKSAGVHVGYATALRLLFTDSRTATLVTKRLV